MKRAFPGRVIFHHISKTTGTALNAWLRQFLGPACGSSPGGICFSEGRNMYEKNIQIGNAAYCLTSDDEYLAGTGSIFEPHLVQLFRALIGAEDTVADTDANIGLTSILFSSSAQKVYAFKPSLTT